MHTGVRLQTDRTWQSYRLSPSPCHWRPPLEVCCPFGHAGRAQSSFPLPFTTMAGFPETPPSCAFKKKHLISPPLPCDLARYTHRPSPNVAPHDATNNGKDGEHPALFTTSVTISHHSLPWPISPKHPCNSVCVNQVCTLNWCWYDTFHPWPMAGALLNVMKTSAAATAGYSLPACNHKG